MNVSAEIGKAHFKSFYIEKIARLRRCTIHFKSAEFKRLSYPDDTDKALRSRLKQIISQKS